MVYFDPDFLLGLNALNCGLRSWMPLLWSAW